MRILLKCWGKFGAEHFIRWCSAVIYLHKIFLPIVLIMWNFSLRKTIIIWRFVGPLWVCTHISCCLHQKLFILLCLLQDMSKQWQNVINNSFSINKEVSSSRYDITLICFRTHINKCLSINRYVIFHQKGLPLLRVDATARGVLCVGHTRVRCKLFRKPKCKLTDLSIFFILICTSELLRNMNYNEVTLS